MSESIKLSREILFEKGFLEIEYLGGKAFSKQIAESTFLRFGGQFNGALELELPDGNDGQIILVPNVESWSDIERLEKMFAGIWIDTGHTLSHNSDEATP